MPLTLQPSDCISEALYMDMADRLAADGYAAAGYQYINIDDCWASLERDPSTKEMVGDPKRFPSGMKALGDYVHARGLKYGIYSDVGTNTCGGYPGSKGYETIDAQTFASWGVDSLKLDGCYATADDFATLYPLWTKLLNDTGRHILYECRYGGIYVKVNYVHTFIYFEYNVFVVGQLMSVSHLPSILSLLIVTTGVPTMTSPTALTT